MSLKYVDKLNFLPSHNVNLTLYLVHNFKTGRDVDYSPPTNSQVKNE
jgi:hypothetical protein